MGAGCRVSLEKVGLGENLVRQGGLRDGRVKF